MAEYSPKTATPLLCSLSETSRCPSNAAEDPAVPVPMVSLHARLPTVADYQWPGANLVWTEPAVAPTGGVAFVTNLTPTTFSSSESATTTAPGSFFFLEPPSALPPKRPSHKRKPTTPTPAPAQNDAAQHIPRPPNAFILFRSAFIRSGAVPASSESSHATLSTIAGLAWSTLPPAARGTWHEKARRAREEHGRRFPGYAFRPKRGASRCEDDDGVKMKKGKGESAPKRRTRETAPADLVRCEHIAKLLAQGRTGAGLEEEVRAFDAERGERVMEVRWESDKECDKECDRVRKTAAAAASVTRRRRVKSEPAPSEPTSPVSPSVPGPFDFDFDFDSIDDTTFAWPPTSPYATTPQSSPIPFSDSPLATAPPSPALSFASSPPSSAWSSLDDLSLASFGPAPPFNLDLSGLGVYVQPCDLSLQPAFELDLGLALDAYGSQQQYLPEYAHPAGAVTW